MNRDHYGPRDNPPSRRRTPPPIQYGAAPRKRMDRSAVVGIVITAICFVMLFVALFAPWFRVKHEDYRKIPDPECPFCDRGYSVDYVGDGEFYCYQCDKHFHGEFEYKWNSYDYSGEGYGKNDDDNHMKDKVFKQYDSMDNGKIQGFWGIILGMVFGIGLIVLGNIHLRGGLARRLMVFFRGATGIILLLPATFLMTCGSKFTGLSISESTSGTSESEYVMLCIVPYLLFIMGLILFILAFGVIFQSYRRLSGLSKVSDCPRDKMTRIFTIYIKKLAIVLIILGIFAVVTLPLLPIVTSTDTKDTDSGKEITQEVNYDSSGKLLCDEGMDRYDFADYLGWVNFAFWFILPLTLIALLSVLFLASGINALTGYILSLIGNLIAIFLVLAIAFKVLFIVDVFNDDYERYASEGFWYGYNYFPLLMLLGLVIVCILYMIHTIKGSAAYFRSIPRRPMPYPRYYAPPRIDYYGKGGRRRKYPPPPDWDGDRPIG